MRDQACTKIPRRQQPPTRYRTSDARAAAKGKIGIASKREHDIKPASAFPSRPRRQNVEISGSFKHDKPTRDAEVRPGACSRRDDLLLTNDRSEIGFFLLLTLRNNWQSREERCLVGSLADISPAICIR